MTNEQVVVERASVEQRPGIFMIGSSNVGKRTLLSRLLSVDFEDASDSASDALAYGWTINTKYYTADVSVWMSHLHDDFSIESLPIYDHLAALVMVFDMNDLSSLAALKEWVSHTDIQKFDILLCIGNKVDLLSGHSAHVEYRRQLQKLGESSFDPDFSEYGISETEGVGLLGAEEPPSEIKRSCLEWCTEHNIEYIEACASNADFDRCLSVDGDLQGVERLYGALSAYMWPGMVLKSGDKIAEPSLPEKQELSEEESDYEFEYEVLSAGSAEPWDDTDGGWVSADGPVASTCSGVSAQNVEAKGCEEKEIGSVEVEHQPSTSISHSTEETDREILPNAHEHDEASELDKGTHYDFEDLEKLMSEIGNVRDNLRLMPDFQRREMAAKLALKMASMFGESSGDEEGLDS
ncbi:GTP binding protein [Actinidia rufa]|uniref:GTP binding protein n=1 Tax=Actinidia rufa TaxID=165716 RepID=A0A7J0GFB3_9ERIC|nr:GTP binding protein [Actinidia rufa]